jgi:hypothetical protein
MNCNLRLKAITQGFYRYLYMRANFQASCYIPGVAKSSKFAILYGKKRAITWGNYATAPPFGARKCICA